MAGLFFKPGFMPGLHAWLWFCPCGSLCRRMIVLSGGLFGCTAIFCSAVTKAGCSVLGSCLAGLFVKPGFMPGLHAWLWFCPCGSLCRRMIVLVGSLFGCTAAVCSMVTGVGYSGAGLMPGWFCSSSRASCLGFKVLGFMPGCGFAPVVPFAGACDCPECSEWRSLWLHCCFLQDGD